MENEKITLWTAIRRGSRGLCPRCAKAKIFLKWGTLVQSCEHCRLPIRPRDTDTWFFMYMTTAGITGGFIWFMVLFTPRDQNLAKVMIAISALIAFLLTMPARKGMAIGIEYYVESRSQFKKFKE